MPFRSFTDLQYTTLGLKLHYILSFCSPVPQRGGGRGGCSSDWNNDRNVQRQWENPLVWCSGVAGKNDSPVFFVDRLFDQLTCAAALWLKLTVLWICPIALYSMAEDVTWIPSLSCSFKVVYIRNYTKVHNWQLKRNQMNDWHHPNLIVAKNEFSPLLDEAFSNHWIT